MQYFCLWLSVCCHIFYLWKFRSTCLAWDSILPIFRNKDPGFLMSVSIQVTSQVEIKENYWSNTIPPHTPNTRRIIHWISGHPEQTTACKSPEWPRSSLAQGSRAVRKRMWRQAWKTQSHLSKESTYVYHQTDGKPPSLLQSRVT